MASKIKELMRRAAEPSDRQKNDGECKLSHGPVKMSRRKSFSIFSDVTIESKPAHCPI